MRPTSSALAAAIAMSTLAGCPKGPTRPPSDPVPTRRDDGGTDVTLTTADGVKLAATQWPGAADNERCVIMVHQLSSTREEWAPFVAALGAQYEVLTFDMRGHGGSTAGPHGELSWESFGDPDWRAAVADVEAAMSRLAERGFTAADCVLVGSSIGSSLVVTFASEHQPAGIVMLSPGLSYRGVEIAGPAAAFRGQRLVLYSEEEGAAETVAKLDEIWAHDVELIEVEGTAHGVSMADDMPALVDSVVGFIERVLSGEPPPVAVAPPAITWEADDLAYLGALIEEVRRVGAEVPELAAFADAVQRLLAQASQGEITKEQLLEGLAGAEDLLDAGAEPDQPQLDHDLAATGALLKKSKVTKALGAALASNDLAKAQQELTALAVALDAGGLDKKQRKELATAMAKAAKVHGKAQRKRDQEAAAEIAHVQTRIGQIEKQRDQGKDEQRKQDAERRLAMHRVNLEKLEMIGRVRAASIQRQAIATFHVDLAEVAVALGKKGAGAQAAAEKLEAAAAGAARIDHEQRKWAAQRKLTSQLDDLREVMRRARKGPTVDPFGAGET